MSNPLSPMTHYIPKIEKSKIFRFLNPMYGAQRTCQPNFSAQLCSRNQILVFAIQILAQRATLRNRKVRKSKVKITGITKKIKSILLPHFFYFA